MALQALGYLKQTLSSVPSNHGETTFPSAIIREQIQLLKQDAVTTYHREELSELERFVDKGSILQTLACYILLKISYQKMDLLD